MLDVYKHIRKPINITGGLSDRIFFAPIRWFEIIAEPTEGGNINNLNIITKSHKFKNGKGFIEMQCAPLKNQMSASSLSLGLKEFNLKARVNGSFEQLHNTFSTLENEPLLVLVQDGNCRNGIIYQLGCSSNFAWLVSVFNTGEGKGGGKYFDINFSYIGKHTLFYKGKIQLMDNVLLLEFFMEQNKLFAKGYHEDLEGIKTQTTIDETMNLSITNEPSGVSFSLENNNLFVTQTPTDG